MHVSPHPSQARASEGVKPEGILTVSLIYIGTRGVPVSSRENRDERVTASVLRLGANGGDRNHRLTSRRTVSVSDRDFLTG